MDEYLMGFHWQFVDHEKHRTKERLRGPVGNYRYACGSGPVRVRRHRTDQQLLSKTYSSTSIRCVRGDPSDHRKYREPICWNSRTENAGRFQGKQDKKRSSAASKS